MKKIIFAGVLISSQAWGHGSMAVQASEAVKVATRMFTLAQSVAVQKQFAGVQAIYLGHEHVGVTIAINTGAEFKYDCLENETVSPVVWECVAQ